MLPRIYATIVLITLTACSERGQTYFKPEYSVIMPPDKGAGLVRSGSRQAVDDYQDFFTLTDSDIRILEDNFRKVNSVSPTGCCYEGQGIRKLEEYGYQYVGVIINNQRYVYINAFVLPNFKIRDPYRTDWTKEIIGSRDGGNSFWGVLFNLNKKKFERLAINGTA